MIEIKPYTPEFAPRWDEMARASRNATFLLQRGYMDYHSDRFADCSVIAERKGKPVALLPACRRGDTVSSHAGLTYGGWILPPAHIDGGMLLEIFGVWLDYLRREGVRRVEYKPLPYIYAFSPSQEDLYALWRHGFTLSSRQLSSAVDLRSPWKFDMSKRQQVRKASAQGFTLGESEDWEGFYDMLAACLAERHDAAPVHTLSELLLLKSRFPGYIRLFTATDGAGAIHAGTVIYDTGRVAHSQYAATTPEGRARYMLTALYHRLMSEEFASRAWFDFGTSNEQGGRMLNEGLLSQKFAMGGSGVTYDTYTLNLT